MNEEWKIIEECPNYSVSNLGRVRNDITGKIRKPTKCGGYNGNGGVYLCVGLSGSLNGQKLFTIHRLVATAFIPNPDQKTDVNHIDGDKFNNVVSNLEWVSHKQNMDHAREVLHRKIMPPKKVVRVEDGQVFNDIHEAAKACGLKSFTSISHCLIGGRYRKTAAGYHWKYSE